MTLLPFLPLPKINKTIQNALKFTSNRTINKNV